MITERKAIAEMFNDLQEEKRQLKANYRTDLAQIEERQERLLERLSRLDDIERESIDVEGTLTKLAETASQLGKLIPQVPASEIIERAAQQIAAGHLEGTGPKVINFSAAQEEQITQARAEAAATTAGTKQPRRNAKDVLAAIEDILERQSKPMSTNLLEKEIKKQYGWEWVNFGNMLKTNLAKHSSNIVKSKGKYKLNRQESAEHGNEQIQEEAPTV